MRALLFMLVLANASCLRKTAFECSNDNACGASGRCESTGFCSFADGSCSTGRRYDQSAGMYGGQCTGDGSTTDGGTTDTPPNMSDGSTSDTPAAACPGGYTAITGGQPGHVYQLMATPQNWSTQEGLCQVTSSSSHLAVPDDLAELTALDTLAGTGHWVGITDSVNEGTYVNVLGQTQTFLPWTTGAPNNAGGGQGEDCVESLDNAAHEINDRRCQDKLAAVCECSPP